MAAVRVFPVKSMDAVETAAITLDAGGVVGDRRFAADGAVVTAEVAPALRTVVAAPGPQVTLPGEGSPVSGAAARGEHDVADCACSLDEPRANVVLDLNDAAAREVVWVGHDVAVGGAVLRLHARPGHCLGVYAEVRRPGRIRPGDVVTVTAR